MSQKTMVIGITGPSGCGKTTLAQSLFDMLNKTSDASVQAHLFPEDPKYFLTPKAASYRDQSPDSETPDFINWDVYVTDLQKCLVRDSPRTTNEGSKSLSSPEPQNIDHKSVWIVDHFLLLHDQRVVTCLDVLIFLDPLLNNDDTPRANRDNALTSRKAAGSPFDPRYPIDENLSTLAARDACRERRVERNPNRLRTEQDFLRRYYNHFVWPAYLRYTHDPAQRYLADYPDRCLRIDCLGLSKEQILSLANSYIQEQWRLKF